MIAERIARRARWLLETLGSEAALEDLEISEAAWAQVERGERPDGDELAEAFFHLTRVEERGGPRDEHGRFPAAASCLDPLDPPLERLRSRLGVQPPRFGDARFAVCLTHDVDVPWRWTRIGVLGSAARVKEHALGRRGGAALREARALAGVPVHKLRGTDPNWRFDRILALERERGARSTFFVMGGHAHRADGASPEAYARLRPRLVETLRAAAEIGLHGSYTAATDPDRLRQEKEALEELAGPVAGHRYHYLRVNPADNLAPLDDLGFSYDTSLGFPDAIGFRAGIARPFRPWDFARDAPLDLVEIPLAVMDASFEDRYLGLSARQAQPRIEKLLDRAAEHGGAFAVLWHTDRFDRGTSGGWDRLYAWLIDAVHEREGVCLAGRELAAEASSAPTNLGSRV
jgi:peptidoglycan/xylan/chitin deacetylase (PgdA/CDA1 family)